MQNLATHSWQSKSWDVKQAREASKPFQQRSLEIAPMGWVLRHRPPCFAPYQQTKRGHSRVGKTRGPAKPPKTPCPKSSICPFVSIEAHKTNMRVLWTPQKAQRFPCWFPPEPKKGTLNKDDDPPQPQHSQSTRAALQEGARASGTEA